MTKIRNFVYSRIAATVFAGSLTTLSAPAQAYQVDCAILLCLSGGWPASAECAHARAVFIRRITPWPIEPPLQIWRCPMGASVNDQDSPSQQLRNLAFNDAPPLMSEYHPDDFYYDTSNGAVNNPISVKLKVNNLQKKIIPADLRTAEGEFDANKFLKLTASQRADIDISGPEFNFIRSIKVYNVRSYSHVKWGRESSCEETWRISIGYYGTQGEYLTRKAHPSEMPSWVLKTRRCGPNSYQRGVGISWSSYQGVQDREWVSY